MHITEIVYIKNVPLREHFLSNVQVHPPNNTNDTIAGLVGKNSEMNSLIQTGDIQGAAQLAIVVLDTMRIGNSTSKKKENEVKILCTQFTLLN